MFTNLLLKSIRVKNGLTQSDMSKILRINKGSYAMKENGQRIFKTAEIQVMYEYFKLTPEELVEIFFTGKVHTKRTKTKSA